MNARILVFTLTALLPTLGAAACLAGVPTLLEVLRDVAVANPTLQAKRAMADAASERVRPAGAWEAPMLELGVANLPLSGRFSDDMMTMKMVGLAQRVPLSGANGLRRRAAWERSEAEWSAADRAQLDLLGEAIEVYADVYFTAERLREVVRHRGAVDRLVDAANARYRSGSGRLDDLLRAQAERARVSGDEVTFRADLESSRAALDALRGVEPAAFVEDSNMSSPPPMPLPPDASSWIDVVRLGHPRLQESIARERAYRLASMAARRAAWPDLELRASYGQRGRDRFGTEQDDMVSASVGFMLPVGSGSREGSMAAEWNAMERAAQAERREAELELTRRVRTLHAEARAASRMVALLADTVVATQARAVEASWSAYAAGSTDLSRVFEANHMLYTSDLQLLDARQRLARAQGRLVALTGRGDLAGVELPSQPVRRTTP